MNKIVNGICVDAGIILISDYDYYIPYGRKEIPYHLSVETTLQKGIYDVKWVIRNTWNGLVKGKGVVKITSGKLVISDPCYIIDQELWQKWLEKEIGWSEDIWHSPKNTILIDSMGGDGMYNVELTLTRKE